LEQDPPAAAQRNKFVYRVLQIDKLQLNNKKLAGGKVSVQYIYVTVCV